MNCDLCGHGESNVKLHPVVNKEQKQDELVSEKPVVNLSSNIKIPIVQETIQKNLESNDDEWN
jgi:hypothetical protein